MKKYFLITCSIIISAFLVSNVYAGGKTEKVPEGKIAVAATFDAMQELTKVVGKDKVHIYTIIPPGVEAHDFEPKAGDLTFLTQAKAVVYNGFDMEPWLDDALHAVKREDIRTICATTGITPIELAEGHHHHHHHHGDAHGHDDDHDMHEHDSDDCDQDCCCGHDHGDNDAHDHHEHAVDPHVWLSLESAKIMVKNIAAGLSEVDPANAAFYQANAAAFTADADKILVSYKENFAKLSHRRFVTGHAAFGYLCRDFNIEQNSVEDVFSEGEPSAKQLAKLIDYCNQYGIKTVFTETAASPQVSQTLAKEVGASVETIYTIESAEDGMSYMERMRSNIEKIYKSLAK